VRSKAKQGVLDHGMLPDPELQEMNELRQRVEALEEKVRQALSPVDHS
jgi:hypothetical protein